MNPIRIQRKRTKGWKMPENTIYVGRPSKWGNPFYVGDGFTTSNLDAVIMFEAELEDVLKDIKIMAPKELRGKNLACWCALNQPCHGDILLELANKISA